MRLCSIADVGLFDGLDSPFGLTKGGLCVGDEIYWFFQCVDYNCLCVEQWFCSFGGGVVGECVGGGNNNLACCRVSLTNFGATFNFCGNRICWVVGFWI